jgi:hypothetical protein
MCGGNLTTRVSRSTRQPPSAKHVERLVALEEHARALEHLERRAVEVVEVGVAEELEAQADTASDPGLRVAFHWCRSFLRHWQQRRLPLPPTGRHPQG